ncbi:hypothetical protein GCM10022224_090280 [Nonomuraea antimicrobica]|uniref:Uncharacterized protein n=1 Tax=Nonomuraea antimicrobica TaxID=561173 RepID=A0ABP7DWZ6_9ACTN
MRAALPDLEWIVPGHGPIGDGPTALAELIAYLERLEAEVSAAVAAGRTLDETYAVCTDPWARGLPESLTTALAAYGLPRDAVHTGFRELARHLHRLNVLVTYRMHSTS